MGAIEQIPLKDTPVLCTFCGVSSDHRFYMVGSNVRNVRICDKCIDEAGEQLYYARILASHTHQEHVH